MSTDYCESSCHGNINYYIEMIDEANYCQMKFRKRTFTFILMDSHLVVSKLWIIKIARAINLRIELTEEPYLVSRFQTKNYQS